ncbi:unnamed protein product [Scytosiphon promiscuus]
MSSSSRLVLWGLGLSSLATSFTPHQCMPSSLRSSVPSSSPASPGTPSSIREPGRRHRCPTSPFAEEEGQRDKDGAAGRSASVSEFEQTSGPVKAFVGGLTDLFVIFSGGDNADATTTISDESPKAALSVGELEAGIRQEYAKNYLWTGDINEGLYEEDCSFTDPTLSFSGLSTYKRNVGSLQGVLDLLVSNSRSELYSCELSQEGSCVQTRWRMVGDLRLPWGPTIDVVGRTKFSYDSVRGNRIFSYDEVWEVEPAEALMQIFKPGRWRGGPLSPDP